ncbi:MAG: 5-(carboxyamino)imidazole ribonucleotide synthase, partial [Cyanobacteriota bacterium]
MTTSASIGIVGGGQLAWMLAREAQKLGVELHVQTPDPRDPAAEVASSVVLGALDDLQATRTLAQRAERISFENELVSLPDLEQLEREGIPFLPSLASLAPLLDKRSQRQLLNQLNLPTPHWAPLEDALPPAPLLPGEWEREGFELGWHPNPSVAEG